MHARGRSHKSGQTTTTTPGKASDNKVGTKHISIIQMLDKFHDIIGGIHVPVDDGVDKLNRKYTLLVFLFLALPIFTKQYIGDPIECFAPVYFAEHQSRYINSYCWTQSTYYMVPVGDPEDDGDQQEPPDRIMPDEIDYFIGFETVTHIGNERMRRVRVSYYQWAPLILLVQGLCFYIPFLIWNSCANNAGVKLRRLLKKASDIASLPPGCQQREALLAEFVDQFHTLVTGEAGWCTDLQCNPTNSSNMNGVSGGSNSSSLSSGSSTGGMPPPPPPLQIRGAGGGGGSGGHQGRGQNQQAGGARGGGGGAAANHQEPDEDQGRHSSGRSHHHQNNNNQNNNNAGCCLVSIPIIGSLLACCLKPCTSFGLVGPSKYLCLLYLAVKFAYVFNVGLQFFLLGQFLGRGYLKHGLELVNRLIVNGDWWASPRFPLSTLCQVRADMSGGLRSYTCQCVLPINVFNEKIFSVVWFYMAFLMPLNVLSLLFWIYRTFESNRLSYIRLCLWRTRLVELNQIHRTVRKLSQSYLGWDGVFLLRLIEHNHGSIMATLIMSRLWEFYANQMKLQEDANMIAMANNAQHTLSNTTTAISNQHQLLAAAAAASAAAQITSGPPPPIQLGGGGGGHHHMPPPPTGGGGGSHGHSHGPAGSHGPHGGGHGHGGHPPPLMPALPHAGGGQFHGNHAHGHPPMPNGHSHGPVNQFAGAGGNQQQQQQVMQQPHGPHAHHSGQISSQPGHHPLHAANTHAAAAAAAAAHAHAHAHAHPPPPHLATGPFGPNASLLAQLQQQQHHHSGGGNAHPPGPHPNPQNSNVSNSATKTLVAGVGVQANNNNSNNNNQQGPASGNVAAAVAALAAAAAANSTTNNQQQANSSTTTNQQQTMHHQQQQQQASATTTQNHIHLQSLLQKQQQTSSGSHSSSTMAGQAKASSTTATNNTGGLSSSSSNAATATTAPAPTGAGLSSTSGQQTSSSVTTSFITNVPTANGALSQLALNPLGGAPLTSGGQANISTNNNNNNTIVGGPPLPPPPPPHVVAAVAAAAAASSAVNSSNPTSHKN